MKRSYFPGAVNACIFSLIMMTTADAELHSRLGGAAAYDDALNITWLTDAALSGNNSWTNQLAWVDSLNSANHLGFNDWRLASMSVAGGLPTGSAEAVVDCSTIWQPLCQDNELGYMFYHNLGGSYGGDLTGNRTVGDVTLSNIQPIYWSATESGITNSWMYHFDIGFGVWSPKNGNRYAWAVRPGDVGAGPNIDEGTWSTTLLPRDLDGNLSTAEAYHDTVLNITWLRDANFAIANQFGLTLSESEFDDTPDTVGSTGRMTWYNAIAWIAGMNTANYGGANQWRLPNTNPIDYFTTDDANYAYNGSEDLGYNVSAPGTGYAGSTASEMAYMSYHTLANLGYCDPVSSGVTFCSPLQTGWGINNTGPFDNIKTSSYWSATDYAPVTGNAWLFNFRFGEQKGVPKLANRYAWAVHPGDIGTAMVPYIGDGDLAPLNAPDGIVNAADMLVATRITLGLLAAGPLQLAHGDVYPPGNPDGVINLQDLILITQIALQ